MSHKRATIEPPLGVQIGLIITPFLDMSFQILAFFIMTYNPAALEGHIDGNLTPPEDFAKKSKDTPFTPPDEKPPPIDEDKLLPKLDKVITVFIDSYKREKKADAEKKPEEKKAQKGLPGTPRQIKIRAALDTASDVLEDSDDPEFKKNVIPKLEKRLKELNGGKGGDLKIAADGDLSYQYVLMVYDAAKRSGYTTIHFVPPQIKPKRKG